MAAEPGKVSCAGCREADDHMAHGSKHRRQDDTDTAFEDALAAYATPHT